MPTMKYRLLISLMLMGLIAGAQTTEHIIIITTDGFRWQELFRGMDPALASDKRFNEDDSALIFRQYNAPTPEERRQKLLPFFWNTIAKQGRIYGNRSLGNLVNVSNPHWFSYPGYSEILTGHVDAAINSNDYPPNPHVTLPEFLNNQPRFRNKVAAFGAWNAFDRILNEKRSGIPVVSAYDVTGGTKPTEKEKLINAMLQNSYKMWQEECMDVFTHYAAMEHLKTKKPKVLYIAYGETDEWAHGWKYRSYLDAAHQVDKWIGEIWAYVESDPEYRNKTTLFITTDHGRGDSEQYKWTSHGADIKGADEIWFAVMGPTVSAKGEMKNSVQYYQKQFAQTMARILGVQYQPAHPVADPIAEVLNK